MEDLYDFAKAEFALDKRPKDSKATNREHLTAIWQQTGVKPVELDNVPPSSAVHYLLDIFYRLSIARQMGMATNPILYSEILAWSNLTEWRLSQWEIDVIKQLDLIWLNTQNE
ncbi:hypothetical protein FW755_12395 [Lonepinella koalarum]|nr:hypothetical protein FW755_12395 [Lonepinella koalarum]